MAKVKSDPVRPERRVTLLDFGERVFLPWSQEYKRASAYYGYRKLSRRHLKPLMAKEAAQLAAVRTVDVQGWLDKIGTQGLGRNSIRQVKAILSSLFSLSKRLGYFDGVNPVVNTAINPKAPQPEETHAYTLDEVLGMLAVFPEPAATVFAVAAFAGLRLGEIQGLDWSDLRDGELHIMRSVWQGHVGAPKTKKSMAAVPVIATLQKRLTLYRESVGSHSKGRCSAAD